MGCCVVLSRGAGREDTRWLVRAGGEVIDVVAFMGTCTWRGRKDGGDETDDEGEDCSDEERDWMGEEEEVAMDCKGCMVMVLRCSDIGAINGGEDDNGVFTDVSAYEPQE